MYILRVMSERELRLAESPRFQTKRKVRLGRYRRGRYRYVKTHKYRAGRKKPQPMFEQHKRNTSINTSFVINLLNRIIINYEH